MKDKLKPKFKLFVRGSQVVRGHGLNNLILGISDF